MLRMFGAGTNGPESNKKQSYHRVGGDEAAANSKICIFFDTVWSICVFSITVILINSNSAVDVKITWTVELLVIRMTGNVAFGSFFVFWLLVACVLSGAEFLASVVKITETE